MNTHAYQKLQFPVHVFTCNDLIDRLNCPYCLFRNIIVLFTGVEHETWPHSQVVVTNNVFRGIKQFCNHGNSPKSAQPTLGSKTTFVAQQPRSSHYASEMLNKKILLILQMPTSSFLGRFDEISGGGRHLCIGRFHKESIIGTFHLTSLMSVVLELKDV